MSGAYTAPRTWVAGEVPSAGDFNTHLRDMFRLLTTGPYARVGRTSTLSVATSTDTVVDWQADSGGVLADSDGMWVVGSPSRLTIVRDGLYGIGAGAEWASSGVGARRLRIFKNGATIIAADRRVADGGTSATLSSPPLKLVVGDYITLDVWQNSGGALNLTAGDYVFLAAAWVGHA